VARGHCRCELPAETPQLEETTEDDVLSGQKEAEKERVNNKPKTLPCRERGLVGEKKAKERLGGLKVLN